MNARELIRALEQDGWVHVRMTGSHYIMKHPTKPGLAVIPLHGPKDLKPGTLRAIERDTGTSLRRR